MLNLIAEFEKKYRGDVTQTEAICNEIAIENNLDPEFVADHIYVNRYNQEESLQEYDSDADESNLESKGLFRCSNCSEEIPLVEKHVNDDMNWYCDSCARELGE